MDLSKAIFVDVETCLIKTKSGRKQRLGITDWVFNDYIIDFTLRNKFTNFYIVADKPFVFIIDKAKYVKFLNLVQEQLYKIFKSKDIQVNIVFYNSASDEYFHYPNPGGIFNYCIEDNINLYESYYISDNDRAKGLSGIKNSKSLSEFLLND